MAHAGGRPRVTDELLINATVRLDGDHWVALERLYGKDRGAIVRQLIAWHLRTGPGAPPRPTAEQLDQAGAIPRQPPAA